VEVRGWDEDFPGAGFGTDAAVAFSGFARIGGLEIEGGGVSYEGAVTASVVGLRGHCYVFPLSFSPCWRSDPKDGNLDAGIVFQIKRMCLISPVKWERSEGLPICCMFASQEQGQ
jgi:hypothetical protein